MAKKSRMKYPVDQLEKINLKPVCNYLIGFNPDIKVAGCRLKRPTIINKQLLNIVLGCGKSDNPKYQPLIDFCDEIKNTKVVNDDEKLEIYNKIKDFVGYNTILTIEIDDNDNQSQLAIVIWTVLDERLIFVNRNLDKSYGSQAENGRIKISGFVNMVLNYCIFKSDDNFGKIINDKLLFINDIIDDKHNDIVAFFDGNKIINRGYYDSPDDFKKSDKTDKSTKSEKSTDDDFDLYD